MKFNQVTWYSKLFALLLFIFLPLIGFLLGMKYQSAIQEPDEVKVVKSEEKSATSSADNITVNSDIDIKTDEIVFKAKYADGTFKYWGIVHMPSPCHKLVDKSLVRESFPEEVEIRLVTEPPAGSVFCAQVISDKEFSSELKVSPLAKISVFLNGKRLK